MLSRKETKEIIENIGKDNIFVRFLTFLAGSMLLAIAFNLFFLPFNVVYGGVSGISIITNNIFGINPSLFVLVTNIILLFVSYFTLGWQKTRGSIVGSIIYPICIALTANIGEVIQFNVDNVLLAIIFGALIAGIGTGINFKSGFTTGGTDIINQILSKYGHMSIGKAILVSDGIIVLAAGFFLGGEEVLFAFENVMYAIIVLYFISLMSDKIMLGINTTKCFYIVTEHETEMKKFLIRHLEHGVTVLDGRGGYTGNKQQVIMCIVPTKEYFLVKEAIHKIDDKAFFVVTDAYQSSGGQ